MKRPPRKILTPKAKRQPEYDLEPFRRAVNEAAARVRGLWLGYIALLAYLFIAVGAVMHRDLLLQNPVKLPVLNVELPLIGFFAVAPAFLLINHFYLLIQLMGLGRRIRWFNDAIELSSLDEDAQRRERSKLDTFVIVQMLGGTKEERELRTGWLLKAIALITLVISPVALLLFIQLQFLPYQYWLVTWMHRGALGIDLALLWVFWPSIGLGDWAPLRGTLWRWATVSIIMFFACALATIPGEFADGGMRAKAWSKNEDSYLSSMKGQLFGDLKTDNRGTGYIPFARALYLSDNTTLINLDKFDKIRDRHKKNGGELEPWKSGRTLDLRERSLRGTNFNRTDLRNVDLYHARLEGASLDEARLQGASLDGAHLQGASLNNSDLQGASLDEAQLQGASLIEAQLQRASLNFADLQGAWLHKAQLQGASLSNSDLQGASLEEAQLQGASLIAAQLQGASFIDANLQGASLDSADLKGAPLDFADLQGASLFAADLKGASLDSADLQGASLDEAQLQGASLFDTNLQGASLVNTFLWRTYGGALLRTYRASPPSARPTPAFIKAPQLGALTKEEIAELQLEATAGIRDMDTIEYINKRLARLSVPDADLEDGLPVTYWTNLTDKVGKDDYEKDLAKRLQALACDPNGAPYVAEGLIRNRFSSPISHYVKPVTNALLNAAGDTITNCPGMKRLSVLTLANLREFVAKLEIQDRRM